MNAENRNSDNIGSALSDSLRTYYSVSSFSRINCSYFVKIMIVLRKHRLFCFFSSSNCSFTECMRKDYSISSSHYYIPFTNTQLSTNAMFTGRIASHQESDLSEASMDGPIYIFECCLFNNINNDESGGAIACIASSTDFYKPQLIIKQSSFNSCKSASGFGGGVYTTGVSSFLVEQTSFIDCNATNGYSGGDYFASGVGFPLLSETSFISCYARMDWDSVNKIDDGGGLCISVSAPSSELHYIIQSCRFISCKCYDYGGGGYVIVSSSIIGCADCIFSACTCNRAEGLGITLGTEDSNCLIHFCYFSCSTGITPPTDISINRQAGSFSSPFLHCFSTKNPSKSVLLFVKWADDGFRNWFTERGIKKIVLCFIICNFLCIDVLI